ncbi:allantoate amidohydrolase [Noviherbaspirillum galbum]|uniref:Allantoate amidohydrolase n=1 Tax=Noviherbaspirillum galbum TaxID=2709383 RepID=A0A6B3SP82_9BURK|nr:allantoate amidohydrolase [Noviherbaspirillum galbum]NEX62557.1 allantoate amidohydrolase [Noviherbaspirillum galbum]
MTRERSIGDTILQWAEELANHTETPGMMTRTYLTEAHRGAAGQIARWMSEAGMNVRTDQAGNVIGRYEASNQATTGARALLTGSHFDTVPNGGKFDGNLGVLLPIACIAEWNRRQKRFPFAIDVIGFAEEEGVRFKATLLGSRAIAGTFDLAVLDKRDEHGVAMREAMGAAGLSFPRLAEAAYRPQDVAAFVEVHIEQGPVLLDAGLPVGVVTAISGASRFMVTVHGLSGHAGTVPMGLRRDAAMAAAEIGLYIESRCAGIPGLVGTVGRLEVVRGAANVVPGEALFSIDIRAETDEVRRAAVQDVLAFMDVVAARRKVRLDVVPTHEARSVPCAPWLQQRLADAAASLGLEARRLPSGAGHDAMAIAAITDVAMLFVRCGNGGISHHPSETMTAEDAETAARVFSRFVENFADAPTLK